MGEAEQNDWWVYIIECEDGALYTGISNNLIRRWREHNAGRGAKFFRSRKAKQVAWIEFPHNHRSAAQREYQIKQLSRPQKLALVKSGHPVSGSLGVES